MSLFRRLGCLFRSESPRRATRACPRLEAIEDRLVPTTLFTVTSLADDGIGRGTQGDLRYCLEQANRTPGHDRITFQTPGRIWLFDALPKISESVTIEGLGRAATRIGLHFTVQNPSPIFTIAREATVSLAHLTLFNGTASGIVNWGTLSLDSVTLEDNSNHLSSDEDTAGLGGGIYNAGSLTLVNAILEGNSATLGGGIYNAADASTTVSETTVRRNSATRGGGIYNAGILSLTDSLLTRNSASLSGDGIYGTRRATQTLTNVTQEKNSTGGSLSDSWQKPVARPLEFDLLPADPSYDSWTLTWTPTTLEPRTPPHTASETTSADLVMARNFVSPLFDDSWMYSASPDSSTTTWTDTNTTTMVVEPIVSYGSSYSYSYNAFTSQNSYAPYPNSYDPYAPSYYLTKMMLYGPWVG